MSCPDLDKCNELERELAGYRTRLEEATTAIKHRHRRYADPGDRWHFRCSCGMGFTDPRDRDEHVIKANEATWEARAWLGSDDA